MTPQCDLTFIEEVIYLFFIGKEVVKTSRKKSIIWKYFLQSDGGKKAQCRLCSQIMSAGLGCSQNLNRHLKHKHPAALIIAPVKRSVPSKSCICCTSCKKKK